MIKCLKVCKQGFSHIAQYKKCQDYAYSFVNKDKTCSIISVADGHGGEKYFRSDVGSLLAVGSARNQLWHFFQNIEEFCKSEDHTEKSLCETNIKLTETKIIDIWRKKVKSHFIKNPLTEKERSLCKDIGIDPNSENEETVLSFYGTTLLAALYIPDKPFWCVVQIGDGLAFALDENNEEPDLVPEDENLGFGYTTSLCYKNAAYNFRRAYGFSKLNALTLCSDGVADSFEKDKFGAFIKKIHANIKEYGSQVVQKELEEFFPKLSEQGSGDDVSLAGVFEVSDYDMNSVGSFIKPKSEDSGEDVKSENDA